MEVRSAAPVLELGWPQIVGLSRFLQFRVRVRVAPGSVTASAKVVGNALAIRHVHSDVVITRARLMPPGFGLRTQLSLVGEEDERVQIAVWWGLSAIVRALEQCGFSVEIHHRWLSPSGTWPPLSTRVRLRRS